MGMAENIRDGVVSKKNADSGEAAVREMLNKVSLKALKMYMQRMDNGEVPIDNMSDLVRVLSIYKEINNIDSQLESGGSSGALPEINLTQESVIDSHVEEGNIISDEEGELDIGSLSEEEVSNLIAGLDMAQNKNNEASF